MKTAKFMRAAKFSWPLRNPLLFVAISARVKGTLMHI